MPEPLPADAHYRATEVRLDGQRHKLRTGSVVIAAITSCTNTSNPSVMVAAGLLARNAVARGLDTKPWVKTSLAPGSRAVTDYLEAAGLMDPLEQLRFHLVGYGCTTCIGNSGPLAEPVAEAIEANDIAAVAVLSGNRNFEGRIHPLARASYLASPPLVVAFALAGRIDIDLTTEPIGTDRDGRPVMLADIWPSRRGGRARRAQGRQRRRLHAQLRIGLRRRRPMAHAPGPGGRPLRLGPRRRPTWRGRRSSTGSSGEPAEPADIVGARALAVLGDSVTTDHISPAGSIARTSPAGEWLVAHGVEPRDFNSYGARRGHHEVMMRGTFANIRLRNLLTPDAEGNVTEHLPSGERMSIFDAAMRYAAEGTPLVILAGKEYGSGSSRDWAAKGPLLQGVRAVIAESFERIHRSNLVGMGILPLQFLPGESAASLGLTGRETFDLARASRTGCARGGRSRSPPAARTGARPASGPSRGSTARSTSPTCATAACSRPSSGAWRRDVEVRRGTVSCRRRTHRARLSRHCRSGHSSRLELPDYTVTVSTVDDLRALIREVPDFPKPGIRFYDITTLLKEPDAFREVIDRMADAGRRHPGRRRRRHGVARVHLQRAAGLQARRRLRPSPQARQAAGGDDRGRVRARVRHGHPRDPRRRHHARASAC